MPSKIISKRKNYLLHNMNSKVTIYIEEKKQWSLELRVLRKILLELPLVEEIKWGVPAYTFNKENIIGIAAFKEYCGLWFHQGVFLEDPYKVLYNAQEGKTKALRQWRFKSLAEINENWVKEYALEAIENAKSGRKIKRSKEVKPLNLPKELLKAFSKDDDLEKAFETFTLSKKRQFVDYINEAKRESTKQKRLEQIILLIKKGEGLYDKYK